MGESRYGRRRCSTGGPIRRAAAILVVAGTLAACSVLIGTDDYLLTGQWGSVADSPGDWAIELVLLESDGGHLSGSGTLSYLGSEYPFTVDSGLVAARELRFRVRNGDDWFGSFAGSIRRRDEFSGSLYVGTAPGGPLIQGAFFGRWVRTPPG